MSDELTVAKRRRIDDDLSRDMIEATQKAEQAATATDDAAMPVAANTESVDAVPAVIDPPPAEGDAEAAMDSPASYVIGMGGDELSLIEQIKHQIALMKVDGIQAHRNDALALLGQMHCVGGAALKVIDLLVTGQSDLRLEQAQDYQVATMLRKFGPDGLNLGTIIMLTLLDDQTELDQLGEQEPMEAAIDEEVYEDAADVMDGGLEME